MRMQWRAGLAVALVGGLIALGAVGVALLRLSDRSEQARLTPMPGPTATPLEAPGQWREWDRGLATWYDGPTDTMRNGEKLDLAGLTCAVDDAAWPLLKGKRVRVRRQSGGEEPRA